MKWVGKSIVALGLLVSPAGSLLTRAHEDRVSKVIPKDIDRSDLRDWNPKGLDASNLEITPLKDFGTMGMDDCRTSLTEWRLIVDGHVGKTLNLSYDDVTSLPSVERAVLMICPGFFANYGLWKGLSMIASGTGYTRPWSDTRNLSGAERQLWESPESACR